MSAIERLAARVLFGVLLVLAAWFGVRHYGAQQHQAGYDAAVAERTTRDLVAVVGRVQDNAALETKYGAINIKITEVKNEELAPVRARIAAERVRVGPAICGGPTAAPEAEDAAGGDGADPAGRLVRADVDRDLRALKLQVEEALATGRACQAWGREHGFVP